MPFHSGDVIGVGVNVVRRKVLFYVNSKYVGESKEWVELPVFPMVSFANCSHCTASLVDNPWPREMVDDY